MSEPVITFTVSAESAFAALREVSSKIMLAIVAPTDAERDEELREIATEMLTRAQTYHNASCRFTMRSDHPGLPAGVEVRGRISESGS